MLDPPGLPPSPTQTPLFHTLHADRYGRQERIRAIEAHTGRRLLCWVADGLGQIDQYDVEPLVDLLQDVEDEDNVDLLLRSPGGVIDTAEKMVMMFRKRCAGFRVIVPESAKSAATLIAIASDEIVMGYASELGPIDPQVPVKLPSGDWDFRPAHSVLDGLAAIKAETDEAGGQLSSAYFPMLQFIDPALLDVCRKAIERSREFARTWLARYQCAGDAERANTIAEALEGGGRHLSHGAAIGAEQAAAIGLNVRELGAKDPLWEALWRLYVDQIMHIRASRHGQLFESRAVSLSY